MRITRRGVVAALGAWGLAACAGSRPWAPIGGTTDRFGDGPLLHGARIFDGGGHVAVWIGDRIGVWSVPAFALESVWPLVVGADARSLAGVIEVIAIGPTVLLVVTDHGGWNLATRLDVATGDRHVLGRLRPARRVFGAPDGSLLISGNAALDPATLASRFTLAEAPWAVAFLADRRHAACGYRERVVIIELATGAEARVLEVKERLIALAAHPIEPRLYLATEEEVRVQDLVSDASEIWISSSTAIESMAALADGSLLITSNLRLEQRSPPDGASIAIAHYVETTTIPVTVEAFPVVDGAPPRALLTTQGSCHIIDLVHHRVGAELPVSFSDHASAT